jgi:signal transduction histidine kinase
MQDLLPLTLEILPEILVQMSPEQRRLFAQLVASLRREDFAGTLSSREQRKHRKALEAQLEAAGVVANYEIASDLLGAGFQGDISPYISLFTSPEAMQISQCVYSLGQVRANLDNINLAVDRTKKVVFALKSYAYTRGDQDERVQLNLAESLETVLTIYHNQIKYGIIVDTHFEEVPIITAYADELSQVWTNLLQNAIQAMKGEGHLRVSLRSVENWVEIRITDNGPGIPVDIQEKIFQPFFTTKKQGEGTGLGLDICKRIVEKHGGTLSLESKPGETTFITRLPVTQPVL